MDMKKEAEFQEWYLSQKMGDYALIKAQWKANRQAEADRDTHKAILHSLHGILAYDDNTEKAFKALVAYLFPKNTPTTSAIRQIEVQFGEKDISPAEHKLNEVIAAVNKITERLEAIPVDR